MALATPRMVDFPPSLAVATGAVEPINLRDLMNGIRPEENWMMEPILATGKLTGFVSARGVGKSLLLFAVAAAKAAGEPLLAQLAEDPIHVLYLDMEMGPDDLYERMTNLGYLTKHAKFDQLEEHLHYYQMVNLPYLDTKEGGDALEALVLLHDAKLVVIDTVSRVVSGKENEAEPYRNLFHFTETRLKRAGVTLARLDHLGKEAQRGSRGSSAKEDPLDVVWLIEDGPPLSNRLVLQKTKGRPNWIPPKVEIYRDNDTEFVEHRLVEDMINAGVRDVLIRMEKLAIPVKTGALAAFGILRDAGVGANKSRVEAAVRLRKSGYVVGESDGMVEL